MATKTSDEKKELLDCAFDLFQQEVDSLTRKEALNRLKERVPGFTERQYSSAWNRVQALFDNSCRLVFRWATNNPPGTEFELPDHNRVFLNDLTELCRGFTDEQYTAALEYGFQKSIF
jgi:hypothetical protein